MLQAFELFVAARYLKAKRKQTVISLITVISIGGVAAGVMALVIALAINNGFRNTLETHLLGATPHVVLLEKEPGGGIENWRQLCERLGKMDGVVSAAPALYGKVFASGPMQSAEATLKGIETHSDTAERLRRQIREGSLANLKQDRGFPGIALGSHIARRTGMMLGSILEVVSPQGELTPLGPRAGQYRFRVVAIFETGFYDIDNQFAFVTLENAQRIFLTGDVVNSIELKLADVNRAPEIAKAVEDAAGPRLGATHWMEQNRQFLSALRLERIVSVITISLIQLVAALNILTALVMSVMEKRRDIAVLMSLGARRRQIARIFVTQGLLIGAAGIVLGLTLGYGLSFLADHYRWIALDEEIYSISYVPFHPQWPDAFWISALALGVSLLATIHPARSAVSISPVDTLRYE